MNWPGNSRVPEPVRGKQREKPINGLLSLQDIPRGIIFARIKPVT